MKNNATLKAQSLLDEYWDYTIPIDVENIIKKLGLTIIDSNNMNGVKSSYKRTKKTIYISDALCNEQRSFRMAHELGHYVLNHTDSFHNLLDKDWIFKIPSSEEEAEADYFARQILMPSIAIKVIVDLHNEKDCAIIRNMFGVTSKQLYLRLKELGYFI